MEKEERIPTGKEYHIDSFEKLVNTVNMENVGDFIVDFAQWLMISMDIDKTLREGKTLTAKQKKLNRWDLLKPTFIWKDDGKNEMTKVIISNPKTGEKTTITGGMPSIINP